MIIGSRMRLTMKAGQSSEPQSSCRGSPTNTFAVEKTSSSSGFAIGRNELDEGSITGTGFMKCMPMKSFRARSVRRPQSRVIGKIDDGVVSKAKESAAASAWGRTERRR